MLNPSIVPMDPDPMQLLPFSPPPGTNTMFNISPAELLRISGAQLNDGLRRDDMHPHEQSDSRLYAAFAKRDAKGMAACYHPDIFFRPAFQNLHGEGGQRHVGHAVRARQGPGNHSGQRQADQDGGTATWANYTLSQTWVQGA